MNETKYSYAVARVRSNELSLLNDTDISQLLSARSYEDALRQLTDKGWGDSSKTQSVSEMFASEIIKTWSFLEEIAPDINELNVLIVKNDYHNLKAALKCRFKNYDPKPFFILPSVYDPDEIAEMIAKKDFDLLPDMMQEAAESAYDILARTEDGQQADIIIDRQALEEIRQKALDSKNELLKKYAEIITVTSNIKIAVRSIKTGKGRKFLELAVAPMETINRHEFITAAMTGEDKLFELISSCGYGEGAEYFKESPSSFEKWCDDLMMKEIIYARHKPFGMEPLAAFYLAREAEIKTVRIILSGKLNGLSTETITERVRELYV